MYKFRIENFNCMSCFRNIDTALKEFDSSIKAKADIGHQIISVESTQPVETIRKLIESAGYPIAEVVNE